MQSNDWKYNYFHFPKGCQILSTKDLDHFFDVQGLRRILVLTNCLPYACHYNPWLGKATYQIECTCTNDWTSNSAFPGRNENPNPLGRVTYWLMVPTISCQAVTLKAK